MESVMRDPDLPRLHRGDIEYALGKAYADLSDFQCSMAHYDQANRYVRELLVGDRYIENKQLDAGTRFGLEIIDKPFLSRHRDVGSADETPIIVVGMIRSGTTLVEQILSCHPEVGGAGEEMFWPERHIEAIGPSGRALNGDALKRLGEEYLVTLAKASPVNRESSTSCPGTLLTSASSTSPFPMPESSTYAAIRSTPAFRFG